jgi:hypothetical protein
MVDSYTASLVTYKATLKEYENEYNVQKPYLNSVVDLYQRMIDAYEEVNEIDVDDYYDLVGDLEDLQFEYDTLVEEQTEK